jgi:prepilin-type N-terminal cleavage/methylation domain-containing protein
MFNSKGINRRGFTLFELLIVLALVVSLFGLLLPALQKVREAADRTKCTNNLHQIMIAAHNFDATNQVLPPAIGPMPGKPGDGTVFFHLLPYVEQDNLFANGHDENGDPTPWGGEVYSGKVPVLLCPSDGTGGRDHLYQDWLATSSYAANYLVFETGGATLARIPDGTSNTMGLAERYQICNDVPCAWAYSSDTEWAPICARFCYAKFQMHPLPGQCNPALPQALHASGIQIAMLDGSVRTVANSGSPQTWYYACTPNGGEPYSLDDL